MPSGRTTDTPNISLRNVRTSIPRVRLGPNASIYLKLIVLNGEAFSASSREFNSASTPDFTAGEKTSQDL